MQEEKCRIRGRGKTKRGKYEGDRKGKRTRDTEEKFGRKYQSLFYFEVVAITLHGPLYIGFPRLYSK